MSTQAFIGVPHGDSWRGRYVHSDGYPTWVGRHVWKLVKFHDVEKVRQVLTELHHGWSQLNSDQQPESISYLGDQAEVIPSWGVAYTHEEQLDIWIGPEQLDSWDWAYVLTDTELWVIKGSNLLGTYPWDGAEPDWKAVEEGAYT